MRYNSIAQALSLIFSPPNLFLHSAVVVNGAEIESIRRPKTTLSYECLTTIRMYDNIYPTLQDRGGVKACMVKAAVVSSTPARGVAIVTL